MLFRSVREKFSKPCISMGNIRNPKVAEQILADGDADLIGLPDQSMQEKLPVASSLYEGRITVDFCEAQV